MVIERFRQNRILLLSSVPYQETDRRNWEMEVVVHERSGGYLFQYITAWPD
ncbi:MAG TPA: hypothetical protein VGD99_29275 [Anaerolineae bacterium]